MVSQLIKFLHFVEAKEFIPYSQVLTSGLFSDPKWNQSTSSLCSLFKVSFNIIPPEFRIVQFFPFSFIGPDVL